MFRTVATIKIKIAIINIDIGITSFVVNLNSLRFQSRENFTVRKQIKSRIGKVISSNNAKKKLFGSI
jgi:hypothetical protein